jgi:predicted alpha/beta hydrolase family esterase
MRRIKSKLLRERLAEMEEWEKKEMAKWWESVLPRKGSVLRHLVDAQLK